MPWLGSHTGWGSACREARFSMGEVEISARAYGKMCLHASRYPYAAVNGLLLAPAPRSGECLCLTDCVPLFHSHLALSVMLEVALSQVWPLESHPHPYSPRPQPPFFRTLGLNACSTPCPQYAPTEPESLIYSRQVDVWGAQAGLVVAGYYHANAALDDQR